MSIVLIGHAPGPEDPEQRRSTHEMTSASPDGYLLGSYARQPPRAELLRLTSFKSTRFDSPANNVGHALLAWAAPRTRTHRSIPAPSTPAGASRLPDSPLPDSRLSCSMAFPRSRHELRRSNRPGPGCSTRRTSLRRRCPGEGFHPIRPRSARGGPPRCLHHFVGHPAKEEASAWSKVSRRVTMQSSSAKHCAMIAAPVQCDVDGIPKGSHYVRIRRWGRPVRRVGLDGAPVVSRVSAGCGRPDAIDHVCALIRAGAPRVATGGDEHQGPGPTPRTRRDTRVAHETYPSYGHPIGVFLVMRTLRIPSTSHWNGCCDHRAMFADEDLHRHAVENLDRPMPSSLAG